MYTFYILILSAVYSVNPILALSVAEVESHFRPHVIGDNGTAYGMFQVRCIAARDVGYEERCEDLKDPELNIKYGIKYLAKQLNKYDMLDAISAYNAGRPIYCEKCENGETYSNQEYVDKVIKVYYTWFMEDGYAQY